MDPRSERERALDFLSRLQPRLYDAIRYSGVNELPQTRQGMLSLATRMWDKYKHEDKKPEERKLTT
jgi:hypothetical protein